jgi:hypothetical protein
LAQEPVGQNAEVFPHRRFVFLQASLGDLDRLARAKHAVMPADHILPEINPLVGER